MDVMEDEVDGGMVMERPHLAMSWTTETMNSMQGMDAICNRCRTGLKSYDREGHCLGKVKKPTRLRTNSPEVFEALDLPCLCLPGTHAPMEGKSKELKSMQNYEELFAKKAASAIYTDMENRWRCREIWRIFVTEELMEEEMERKKRKVNEAELQLAKTHSKQAVNIVAKLHKQLGHPGRGKLTQSLRDAGFEDEIVQCAREYKCDVCAAHSMKKLEKPSSLPQASHFNQILEADTFHIKWNDEKRRVLAVVDVYSRFEINAVIARETEEEEIQVLQDRWLNIFGPPEVFRTDSSGAHMSQKYLDFFDHHGIRLILVPKEAHNRMGSVERLHAVRRLQLLKMQKEEPNILLEAAVRVACYQRNRLRSVHGSSPYQIVFGHNPHDGGLADEPCKLRPDEKGAHVEDQALRHLAAQAFHAANTSTLLKRALSAKVRAEHPEIYIGDHVFYWRPSPAKLDVERWHGPALVCAIEPRVLDDGSTRASVFWVAHGSSLVRVAPEHIRAEVPRERAERLKTQPDSAHTSCLRDRVRAALAPVQGPVRFLDLAGDPPAANASGTSVSTFSPTPLQSLNQNVQDIREYGMDTTDTSATPAKQAQQQQEFSTTEQQAEEPTEIATGKTEEKQANESNRQHTAAAAEATAERRERSRSPPPRDEQHQLNSYNQARQLDGLQPVTPENPQFLQHYSNMIGADQPDDALATETFSEKYLSPEEKLQFDEAKDTALNVRFDNDAWRVVDASEAGPGEIIPARFLQRWKPTKTGKKANARVIIQGFRHRDVLENTLDRESSTLSMTGRSCIYLVAVHKPWKLWTADVKSAFMQADEIGSSTRIYIQPSADMRRRLERKIGLKPWEVMKATRPAFGDVRAPCQWNKTADTYLRESLGLVPHPLDSCVYLSLRLAHNEDDPFCCFDWNGRPHC